MELAVWIALIVINLIMMAYTIKIKKPYWIPTLGLFLLAVLSVGYGMFFADGIGFQDIMWILMGAFFIILAVMSIGIVALVRRKKARDDD